MKAHVQALRDGFQWSLVSGAAWLLLASIIGVIIVSSVATALSINLRETNQRAQDELQRIQQMLDATLKENRLIQDYRQDYELLDRQSLIGAEDRLRNVEAFEQVRSLHRLPSLRYVFEPARRMTTDTPGEAATIYVTRNVVTFALHDETDLELLLQHLQRRTNGAYMIEDCTLSRLSRSRRASPPKSSGNIRGDCTLHWLSTEPLMMAP